jgi:hypothetical protein
MPAPAPGRPARQAIRIDQGKTIFHDPSGGEASRYLIMMPPINALHPGGQALSDFRPTGDQGIHKRRIRPGARAGTTWKSRFKTGE